MDTHALTLEFFLGLHSDLLWNEAQTILRRAAASKSPYWRLPVVACEAVGGEPERAIPAVTAVACAQISITLIDDLLDADPRGEQHRLGVPAVANLAAAFQATALEAVAHDVVACDPQIKLAALDNLNLTIKTVAFGQHLDAQNPTDEAAYWRVVQTKSAPFFGTALHIGALLGGASFEVAKQFWRFGCLYGEMVQIHDDLNDSMATPANPDWTLGRSSLPILFAQVVDHPDRERFLALRQAIPDPEALAEAQSILIRCGAVSYGIHQLLCRYREGCEVLGAMPLPYRTGVEALLEEQVEPVRELFAATGISQPNHLMRRDRWQGRNHS